MPRASLFASVLLIVLLRIPLGYAQQPSTTVVRTEGVDAPSGISWVQLAIPGALLSKGTTPPYSPPILTAQCTKTKAGKLKFELLADFGGVEDRAFYPPWRPKDSHDLFPPRLDKITITMEFFGYTHVKPVKREWVALLAPYGELQYNTPSAGSFNMEEIAFYLRYLLALPMLRLTAPGNRSSEFMTTPLLDAIRKEPTCKAAGL
jgi:hypothetical protein